MVQLIKKGGLRERANRSHTYSGSENTETTLKPNRYKNTQKIEHMKTDVSDNIKPSRPLNDELNH